MNSDEESPPLRSILAVDDDPNVLKMLTLLLGRLGFVVKAASNGFEALQLFRLCPWDAVITDQMMPAMSGEDLAREMRQENNDIPIIVLTGAPGRLRQPELFAAILSKPFTITELLEELSKLFPGVSRSPVRSIEHDG